MKQGSPLAPGSLLQKPGPIRPNALIPRFFRQAFARLREKSDVLDPRFDRGLNDAPPADNIQEGGKIAAHRKPKRLGLATNNVVRGKPIPDRFEAQRMKRARGQCRKLTLIEPGLGARKLAEVEGSLEFIETRNRMKRR